MPVTLGTSVLHGTAKTNLRLLLDVWSAVSIDIHTSYCHIDTCAFDFLVVSTVREHRIAQEFRCEHGRADASLTGPPH